jgi:hypothetical protein
MIYHVVYHTQVFRASGITQGTLSITVGTEYAAWCHMYSVTDPATLRVGKAVCCSLCTKQVAPDENLASHVIFAVTLKTHLN